MSAKLKVFGNGKACKVSTNGIVTKVNVTTKFGVFVGVIVNVLDEDAANILSVTADGIVTGIYVTPDGCFPRIHVSADGIVAKVNVTA